MNVPTRGCLTYGVHDIAAGVLDDVVLDERAFESTEVHRRLDEGRRRSLPSDADSRKLRLRRLKCCRTLKMPALHVLNCSGLFISIRAGRTLGTHSCIHRYNSDYAKYAHGQPRLDILWL